MLRALVLILALALACFAVCGGAGKALDTATASGTGTNSPTTGQSNVPTVVDQNTAIQQLILMRALQSRRGRGGVRTGVPNPIINVGPPPLMPTEDPLSNSADSSAGSSKKRKSSAEKRAEATRKKEEQKKALAEKNEKKVAAAKAKADKDALQRALKRKAEAAERLMPLGKEPAEGDAVPIEAPADRPE